MSSGWINLRCAKGGVVALVLLFGATAQATTLRVALKPSAQAPYQTIVAARDAIRQLRANGKLQGPVTVEIEGGVYLLDDALVFTPEDSGSPDAPVTYESAPGQKVTLSGGWRITGWKRDTSHPGKGDLWMADLPQVREGKWLFHDLYVNGARRQLARSPNTGFFNVDGQISLGQGPSTFRYHEGDIRPEWAGTGAEVLSVLKWQFLRMPITAVDAATRTVTLAGRRPQNGNDRDPRYWVENSFDALDAPGEWYLDAKAGLVYYQPMPGEDMTRTEVIAPHLEQLIRFDGDGGEGRYVHDITLRGLTVMYADWSLGPQGYADIQAASELPAAVAATGGKSLRIEDCEFTRLGQYALSFGGGSKDNRIIGNRIFDLGGGGVKIGDPNSDGHPNGLRPNYPRDDQHTSSGNVISDNHIHHIGNTVPSAVGIWVGQSYGNTLSHNEIDNTYFSGISVGWSWGWTPTVAHDNLIEYNLVHDIGRGLMCDMGCIYVLDRQPGTEVKNNVCHDVTRWDHRPGGYGGWGIYLDSATSGVLVENNIVYRTQDGNYHNQYGEQNIIRNNIFALGQNAQILRTRLAPEISFTFEHNIVYWKEGVLLGGAAAGAGRWNEDKVKFDYNLYYHPTGSDVMFGPMTFTQWQQMGQDLHSQFADPLFVDPDHDNFALQPDSPALRMGFKPIDTSTVGPRPPGPKRSKD
jgi:Right handed beta helix region